jgi:diguanylate cyclase (GGDEF)-like protein
MSQFRERSLLPPHLRERWRAGVRLSLTQKVALLSLVPMVLIGLILTRVIATQIDARSLENATQSARLIANLGIQPRLTPSELRNGLSAHEIRDLDQQLRRRSTTESLVRLKIWNSAHVVVFSDKHSLIGRAFAISDDLRDALAGRPHGADVVMPRRGTETAGEVGLGKLVEVYVPLRFAAAGRPVGAFEIYLSYRPIAATIARDERMVAIVVGVGLALLWASLFLVVARASRRLRRQARENYALARYDRLTGLPNRTLFRERIAAMLARQASRPGTLAVLVIDLDGFKQINNTLGNEIGDEVLRETGRRLQCVLGDDPLVARLGGDEYAVLCRRAAGVKGALRTAAEVQERLEAPVRVGHVALNVEASVGIAVLEDRARPRPPAATCRRRARACPVATESHRGLLPRARQLRCNAPVAARRGSRRARARRVRAALSAADRPRQRPRHRRRGARAVAPPDARPADADDVHPARRADGAGGSDHAEADRLGARAGGALAPSRPRSRHRRQPLCA